MAATKLFKEKSSKQAEKALDKFWLPSIKMFHFTCASHASQKILKFVSTPMAPADLPWLGVGALAMVLRLL